VAQRIGKTREMLRLYEVGKHHPPPEVRGALLDMLVEWMRA